MHHLRYMFALACLITALHPARLEAASPNDRLAKMLVGKNDSVRLQAIMTLQRDPARCLSVLSTVLDAAKTEASKVPPKELLRPSLVEMLNLVGSIDQPACQVLLIELLDAPNVGVAMIASDALGKNKRFAAIAPMKRQIYRPEYELSYGFRFNLVRSFAQMGHPDAIEFLSELQTQLDGQLHFEIEKLLAVVTESDFQGDAARFARWQQRSDPQVVLTSEVSGSGSDGRMRLGKAQQYYGIDIRAKRMMFIIDNSGSMKEADEGVSRLYRAKYELVQAIDNLPNDAQFAILFYSDAVHLWRSQLVNATPGNKRDAIDFVGRLGCGNKTNTHGALRQSLEFDNELEAVFLLTDGRPTTGEIVIPQGIIADIVHRNRFRNLHFNTIGISLDFSTEQFLKTLAENSGGEFRKVN
jgi:von Willebrand factor type A domain